MKSEEANKRLSRKSRHLRWVKLADIKVSPVCQRELRPAWVEKIFAVFDPEQLGNPELNHRDGSYFVMDGQHRIEAAKKFVGEDWESEQIQCWVTEGLSEKEEAETFLKLNNKLTVSTFEKFQIAVHAGRFTECDIERQVMLSGLSISKNKQSGAISCVATLAKIYNRSDAATLGKAIRVVKNAFGDIGFRDGILLDGFALVCQRFNGVLGEDQIVRAMRQLHGGYNALCADAEDYFVSRRKTKPHCYAAAIVDCINKYKSKGTKKLEPWLAGKL